MNEIDSLKCTVRIDYDIPFDFKEDREKAFDIIVNNLHNQLEYIGYNHDIFANYTTCTEIIIYCPRAASRDEWRQAIKGIFYGGDMRRIDISETEENSITEYSVSSYTVDYYLEFSLSENYHISYPIR